MKVENRLTGHCILYAIFAFLTSGCAQALYPVGLKDCAPVYGSWCGEGYPNVGDPDPVDSWDDACRSHDLCYEEAGDNKREKLACDDEFIEELDDLANYDFPIPVEMRNARSWFAKRNTGQLYIWVPAKDMAWSMAADCDGSDGRAAKFCDVGNFYCEMAYDMPEYSRCVCPTQFGGYIEGSVIESY